MRQLPAMLHIPRVTRSAAHDRIMSHYGRAMRDLLICINFFCPRIISGLGRSRPVKRDKSTPIKYSQSEWDVRPHAWVGGSRSGLPGWAAQASRDLFRKRPRILQCTHYVPLDTVPHRPVRHSTVQTSMTKSAATSVSFVDDQQATLWGLGEFMTESGPHDVGRQKLATVAPTRHM